MKRTVYALIDGNSFYASCQMAFNPSLSKRPVVVLSNNDGCIVAANEIAKQLNHVLIQSNINRQSSGFRSAKPSSIMFQPYFKVKPLLDKAGAAVFSSNYELYADMSARMHNIISEFGEHQEVYSIDESFLDLTSFDALYNLTEYGLRIKQSVYQQIGLPVAVGIAETKTLAKLANNLAKKQPSTKGVLDFTVLDAVGLSACLSRIPVGDVWGVGKVLSNKLISEGITTAEALRQSDPKRIRNKYSVVLERTVRELNGEACLRLELLQADKKQIVSSRSFGRAIREYEQMVQAVTSYVLIAAEKLRAQQSHCRLISVYIQNNPHQASQNRYQNIKTLSLIYPSDNSILLAKMAKQALRSIWKPGVFYNKAGVTLSEITPAAPLQEDLFSPNPTYSGSVKQDALMAVMDKLNASNGKGSLFLGSAGIDKHNVWKMNRQLISPRYTTRWDELCIVK